MITGRIEIKMTEQTQQNPLGMKSIIQANNKVMAERLKEHVKNAFTMDWYFHGWEKLIIVASFVWSCYCLGSWIWSII